MRTFILASMVVCVALILFVVGMFSGDGGLMMGIFCLWTPLVGFWGFSFGRMKIRIVVDDMPTKSVKPSLLEVRKRKVEGLQ